MVQIPVNVNEKQGSRTGEIRNRAEHDATLFIERKASPLPARGQDRLLDLPALRRLTFEGNPLRSISPRLRRVVGEDWLTQHYPDLLR